MGWQIGYDNEHQRDIGYGVPAECDFPTCHAAIDRGLGCVCGGAPYGGEKGCGLFFCGKHLFMTKRGQLCNRCFNYKPQYKHPKPDVLQWVIWKARDLSWKEWRIENPAQTKALEQRIDAADPDLVKAILKQLDPTPDPDAGIIEGELVDDSNG
jgi:hypothetical protein